MRPKTALVVLTLSEIIQSPTAKAIAEGIGRARRQKAVSSTRQKREQLSTHKGPETAEPQKGRAQASRKVSDRSTQQAHGRVDWQRQMVNMMQKVTEVIGQG